MCNSRRCVEEIRRREVECKRGPAAKRVEDLKLSGGEQFVKEVEEFEKKVEKMKWIGEVEKRELFRRALPPTYLTNSQHNNSHLDIYQSIKAHTIKLWESKGEVKQNQREVVSMQCKDRKKNNNKEERSTKQ